MTARGIRFFICALYDPLPPPLLCLNQKYKACSVQKVTFQNLLSFPTLLQESGLNVSMPGQSPMLAACSILPHSAPTLSIRWSFIIAMFIFYMSPIISLYMGFDTHSRCIQERLQKINVKLGLLAEPLLTPPLLLTWVLLSGDIVDFSIFKPFLNIRKLA